MRTHLRRFPAPIRAWLLALAAALFGMAAAHGYDITIEPVGHWHLFDAHTLTFHVAEHDTGDPVEGLNVVARIYRAGSERVTERSVEDERVVDAGGGTYTLEYTPTALDAFAVVAGFEIEDESFQSAPLLFQTSKAGEEGIRVDAAGTSFVYQIRYVWLPGHIHANDTEPVTMQFEVMRGIARGDDINWDRPWTNAFDHVTEATDMRVVVMGEDGEMLGTVTPTYMGRGIFEAQRIFSAEEVDHGRDYHVMLEFVDPVHGAMVTHGEPYELHAVPSH